MSTFSLPTLTGTNLKYTKAYNLRIVLETIRTRSPVSRADIARRTDLTPQTVSNIVGELISSKLVQETSLRRRGRGAPSTMLQVNPDVAYSIGLDLDRDHLTGVMVDLEGTVRYREHKELSFPSPKDTVDLMEEVIEGLIAESGIDNSLVSGVGVGIPGPLHITSQRRVSNAVNPEDFPGWINVPIAEDLQNRLDLPVYLENNATAAAVGELWYGAGKTISTFYYLYFGAGLGGGLVIEGRPYRGYSRNAGQVGYLPTSLFSFRDALPANGRSPIVGEPCYLPHLYRLLNEDGIDARSPADLEALYHDENEHILTWMDQTIDLLTPLIVMVDCLIDPAAIFLGGRLPASLTSAILNGLADQLPQHDVPGKTSSPGLLEAAAGQNAAALGLATLPVYEIFAPTPGPYPKFTSRKCCDALTTMSMSE